MSLLGRLAARAAAPVFCIVGDGGRARARMLRLDPRLRIVESPRHATVLLAVGDLPPGLRDAARSVHDQVPAPRGAVVWSDGDWQLPEAAHVDAEGDPVPALTEIHRSLMSGERDSAPALGPRRNPIEWRGVGPHGQGGEGMMGGKPYGRAMAMTGDDVRDGLALDRVAVTLGPFLPWMPTGLRLSLELQGDVVQCLDGEVFELRRADLPEVFLRAGTEDVPVADLEVARAKHHLAATSDLVACLGLDALAERSLRLAASATPADAATIGRFARGLRRTRALRLATRGVGVLTPESIVRGPVARACGRRADARLADPAYDGLGFSPLAFEACDAEARWRQRLAEAEQALVLAARAGDRRRAPGPPLEGPRGEVGGDAVDWLGLLSRIVPGRTWDELVTTLVSLDVDTAVMDPRGRRDSPAHAESEATG